MGKEDAVYFFTGEDDARKNLAVNKIKSRLSLGPESLDCNLYYGDDIAASDIIHTLKTTPFSGKRRLVVLKEPERLPESDKQKIASYLKNPAKDSIFIITTRKDPNAKGKLNIAAKRYAKCIDFPTLERGNNLSQDSAYRLIDEISSKRQRPALKTASSLMQAGKSAHEILGLIAWHMRRLGKVKVLLKRGGTKEEVARDLRLSYNIAQKIINQARNFTLDEIRRAQRLLIETDKGIKKSISTPEVMVEMLIMRLSASL